MMITQTHMVQILRTIVYYERVIPGTMGTFLSGDTQCFSRESGGLIARDVVAP